MLCGCILWKNTFVLLCWCFVFMFNMKSKICLVHELRNNTYFIQTDYFSCSWGKRTLYCNLPKFANILFNSCCSLRFMYLYSKKIQFQILFELLSNVVIRQIFELNWRFLLDNDIGLNIDSEKRKNSVKNTFCENTNTEF